MTGMSIPPYSPTTVIIYGPAGCGKSHNARRIAEHFGCTSVIDDLGEYPRPQDILCTGALHITHQRPQFPGVERVNVINFADLPAYLQGADNLFGDPQKTMTTVEALLCLLVNGDDHHPLLGGKNRYDYVAQAIEDWRDVRGAAGTNGWQWMHCAGDAKNIIGNDGGYWGEYVTRDDCINAAVADSELWSDTGQFSIALCRTYADDIDPENAPLSDTLFAEVLNIADYQERVGA